MKFTCHIHINKPRNIVVAYFMDPQYLGEFQKNFLRKELISGNMGEELSISKLYYQMGKGEMELTETVLENSLPEVFMGQYHHKHMDNTMRSVFRDADVKSTSIQVEVEYTAFRGFMAKTMATLFPFFFKKQVKNWLVNFKTFVEAQ